MATLVPEPDGSDNSITALLAELSAGNRDVEARLIPHVYGELRRLAAHYMRSERGNHTLQPTALVNEAYTRLVQQPQIPWQSRAHCPGVPWRDLRCARPSPASTGLPLSLSDCSPFFTTPPCHPDF